MALLLFLLLLLCEHGLGLVDSPSCQSFKRSSITAIIASTSTNKQPFSIRLRRECEEKLHTCGPLWILFTDLCVFEKGLPRLRWCRGQKSSETRSETNKKKSVGGSRQGSSAAITPPPRAVPRMRRRYGNCDVAAYPEARCTIFTATPPPLVFFSARAPKL